MNNFSSNDKDHSFVEIILILASQIKIIIIVPTILCIITIIYSLFIANHVYTSTSKIMSSSSSGGISQAAGLAAQFGISLPISSGEAETNWVYPEIIKSRTIGRKILKRNFNTREFGAQKSLTQILTYGNEEPQFSLDTLETMALELLNKKIQVSENIKTGIYTLITNASEPVLSAEINMAILEELDSHQREYNKNRTSKTRQFIEERIVGTEKELNSAEENLRKFMDRNRRIENSPTLLLEQQRLNREVTVLTGVFTTLKQQLETTKIEEVKESEYVIILDKPEVPLLRSKPQRTKMVIMSGVFGILLGIIGAFIANVSQSFTRDERKILEKAKRQLANNIPFFLAFFKNIKQFQQN
ncbi:MAG: hypothetical protein CMG57_08625 [Candidatus Marinimicrobia bacterium]|nr:hypothetical protein [Candidatus Neomarinimicrobiota bacterium]|tara:strand:+ start:20635 stop:21708 length:1074 start_codon:yes stop_codon:yes gene_type:complete